MANKGNSGYIKRLNAPKFFFIHRKEHKYTIKQNPGRHTLARSIALTLMLEKLGIASDRSEANRIIRNGSVSVNGKRIMEPKYPVGLNDMILAGEDNHIIGINERGQISISKADKRKQVYKVVGKYKGSKNSIMLRLHDGTTLKGDAKTMVDDSVSMNDGKISAVVKFGTGAKCEVIDGVHVGKNGTIKEVTAGNMHKLKSVTIEQQDGDKFQTLVKNIIIVE